MWLSLSVSLRFLLLLKTTFDLSLFEKRKNYFPLLGKILEVELVETGGFIKSSRKVILTNRADCLSLRDDGLKSTDLNPIFIQLESS